MSKRVFMIFFVLAAIKVAAHDRFIVPSHTVLSGDKGSISLWSSISNDMFHPDRPFGDNGTGVEMPSLKNLFQSLESVVVQPDGAATIRPMWQAFQRFSAADLVLEQSGTWRVCLVQPPLLMTLFTKADGSRSRAFGEKPKLPEGAGDIKRIATSSRVETFVTLNEPTQASFKPTGKGLELSGATHPNDLFVNEPIKWQLFFDGKPLKQATKVTLVKGGVRHRNQREPIQVETNEMGVFELTFAEPGFYLLSADTSFPGEAGSDIDTHHVGLFVTLEVFPE